MFNLSNLIKQIRFNQIKTIDLNHKKIPDYSKKPHRSVIRLKNHQDLERIDEWMSVVVLSNDFIATSANNNIYLWDVNIGKHVTKLSSDTNIKSLLALSDGRFISCHEDSSINLWLPDGDDYMSELLFNQIAGISCLTVLPDNLIVTCGNDNFIRFWDINNKQMIFHLVNESNNKIKMIIADYDNNIVTVDDENTVTFWNIDQSCKRKSFKLEFTLCSLAIDDSGNIFCGDWFGRIIEINPSYSYLITERFKISNNYIYTIKILPDCELLVNSIFDIMCILDQTGNSITQSLSIENKCDGATIEVLSDGRIVVGGPYGSVMILQFPLRQLTISDLYPVFDALQKNKSVTELNIEKVKIDNIHSYNNLTLNLMSIRNDLAIISNTSSKNEA